MNVRHIKQAEILEPLEAWGEVGEPISRPPCVTRGIQVSIPGKEDIDTGIWECSPGTFRRQVKSGEVVHILSGEAIFTPDEGEPISMEAGDVLFMSPNTLGTWQILSTLRKVYVMV